MYRKPIIIIGAGIAGLSAAKTCEDLGLPYILLESHASIGGRIKTLTFSSITIDYGFQVFLRHYKMAKKILDIDQLDFVKYPSGASIITDNGMRWFGSGDYPNVYKTGDKLQITPRDWIQLGIDIINGYRFPQSSGIAAQEHFNRKYSDHFNQTFLTPFFRGVFLDKNCRNFVSEFQYYLRCFAMGGVAVPSEGMQCIPRQLATHIPNSKIITNCTVKNIQSSIVNTTVGAFESSHIILATDRRSAIKILEKDYPNLLWNSVFNYVFTTTKKTTLAPLTLVTTPSVISHINIPTLVSKKLAQAGTHIMNVSSLQECNPTTIKQAVGDLTGEHHWQMATTIPIRMALPKRHTHTIRAPKNVTLAGDWTSFNSIEAAIRSGISAAKKAKKSYTQIYR